MAEKESSTPKSTEAKSSRPSRPLDAVVSRSDSAGKIRKWVPIGDSAPTPPTVNSAAPPPPPPQQGKTKK